MAWTYFTSFGVVFFVVIGSSIIILLLFKRLRRPRPFRSAAPVVVTTTTQVPFTPGPGMQQTSVYPNQPYPMGQPAGYAMPMPAANQQSYPMPQAGYPYSAAPYPPAAVPPENMNPPSYDQVVGAGGMTTTTTTNDSFSKQSPYNPSYTG